MIKANSSRMYDKATLLAAWTFLAVAIIVVSGCTGSAPRRDPEFAAAMPAARVPTEQHPGGSIYQPGHNLYLFEDAKARRIGDTLTIKLVEKTTAESSSSSSFDKESSTTIANPTILGSTPQFGLPGALPLADTDNNTLETSMGATSDFTGKGDNEQESKLIGDITVTVADVLPNGNLVVRGEKRVRINQGNEYVKLSGIVRPIDIGTDNSIPSTKVADATIIYNGDGQTASASKAGWLTRFFTSALSPL
jgi:flagellar L-ring protein precursor FlgH